MKKHTNDEFEIFISNAGQAEWPRYQIQNGKGMFWNGKVWVKDSCKGTMFYWYDEAAVEIKRIEHELNKDKPVTKYEIPMICEIIGDHPLDPEQLKDYISRGVRINLTLPNPEGLVIQLQMNVSSLKEIKSESKTKVD